jgi:tRNA G37 N-methylase Trm5
MALGVKVSLKLGKKVKGLIKNHKLYNDNFILKKINNEIIFPIRKQNNNFENELKEITQNYLIENFDLIKNNRTKSFRRELQKVLPKEIYQNASRAYEQIGDIAIITIFPEMEKYENEIVETLLNTNKGLKTIVKKINKHDGQKRIQEFIKLTKQGSFETTHTENQIKINLDITKTYFSARTANERKRIASLVDKNETILVMFSGCAPYPLVISKNSQAKKIIGVEINENAHNFGINNIKLNKLKNIELINDDVKNYIKTTKNKFDRIIMPSPTNADYFLEDALSVLNKNGKIQMYLFSKPEKLDYVKNKIKTISQKKQRHIKKINILEQLHISNEVKKFCFDIYYV